MNGACLKESLVYYATISCNNKNYQPKLYKGSCETSFKKGYSNHTKSLKKRLYQAINRVLELKNEATKPTDILEDKRNIKVL